MMIFDKAPFPSCHASTLVEVKAGEFLAAWFGGQREGAKDVKIWSSRWKAGKWTPPEVIASEPNEPCWNPVLFRLSSDELLLWYKAGPSPERWSGFLRRSKDDGMTWEPAELLPAGLLGPIRAKPIRLKDGVILAGSSVESYRAWNGWIERSTDNAATWTRHGPLNQPERPYGLIQPTLCETKDGRVLAFCRSKNSGRICVSESKDKGITWSPAKPTTLPNPNSGIDVVRMKTGVVIMIYNHTQIGRSPLNLAASRDDGETWEKLEPLETTAGEFSYPALIEGSDGALHMTYTWNRTHIKYVRVAL